MAMQKPVAKLNPDLADAVEEMLSDGYIEGLTIGLRSKYPRYRDEAHDAVGHAVEKLIQRESVKSPRSYLATSAYNYMKKHAERSARFRLVSIETGGPDGEPLEFDEDGWTVEERALLDEAYRFLVKEVEKWETGNVRDTTLLFLEAAYDGEPLTSADAAELLGSIFGEDVDASFVRTWKNRGFKKLRKLIIETQNETQGAEGQ